MARPFSDVVVGVLPRGGAAFVEALAGLSIGDAAERTSRRVRGFHLKECLLAVISGRILIDVI